MNWDDVRYFLALARAGSVRAAADRVGVSHSTVSRRIEALESELGTRLFDRSRDGYALSAAGAEMLPEAERMEAHAAALQRSLVGRDQRLAGPVRVTCSDGVMAGLLLTGLVPFCETHPGIELEVLADARKLDLSHREADLALRALGPDQTPPDHLLGARLAPIVVATYVGAGFDHARDPDRSPSTARWLGTVDPRAIRHVVSTSSFPNTPIWGAFSDTAVMIQAVRAGLGMVALPTYMGDPDPTLHRIQRPDLRAMGQLWLLSHPDLRTTARLRMARQAVRGVVSGLLPTFRGEGPLAGA